MAAKFIILLFCISILVGGCKNKMENVKIVDDSELANIKNEEIDSLSSKIILFGHASVGYNIIGGIEEILSNSTRFNKIKIKEIRNINDINGPAIYHIVNPKNRFPKEKCDNFIKILREKNLGHKLDIAFFKFCYVDFEKDTDVQKIFEYYNNAINEIKKEFPNLKILHITTPLYAHGFSFKSKIKNILFADYANIQRNRFNDLLRNAYKNNNTIYDLAAVESTYPNGQREIFTHKDEEFFALIKEYTYDGGHLNEVGSFIAAKEILKILVDI